MKQAGIYLNDVFCGILTEDEEGFHFSYDEDYLKWYSSPESKGRSEKRDSRYFMTNRLTML